MGRMRYRDFQSRRVYGPTQSASKRDDLVPNVRGAYQDAAVPAINTVITGASEEVE